MLKYSERLLAFAMSHATVPAGDAQEVGDLLLQGPMEILEAIAEGVLVLDREGRIAYANAAAAGLLGYSARELHLQRATAHELLHHSHADGAPHPASECPASATLRDGATVRVRAADGEVLWRSDGSCFPVSFVSAPVRRDGNLVGAAVVFTDVTDRLHRRDERAALHRDAAESEKLAALGTLVTGLSHEIKTPLAIIQNNAALMRFQVDRAAAGAVDPSRAWDRLRERLEEMESAVERMAALVGGLRRFSRLDGTEAVPAALEDITSDAVRLFQVAFRGQVDVALDIQETRPVLADSLKVQQLLMNLLENAAQASAGPGGSVRVRTRMDAAGDRALLVVEDDGDGIPEDVQARMYDPLFTTRRDGTGLGLAVVKRIADEHGATVECVSAPGKGTIFTIAFPLAVYD